MIICSRMSFLWAPKGLWNRKIQHGHVIKSREKKKKKTQNTKVFSTAANKSPAIILYCMFKHKIKHFIGCYRLCSPLNLLLCTVYTCKVCSWKKDITYPLAEPSHAVVANLTLLFVQIILGAAQADRGGLIMRHIDRQGPPSLIYQKLKVHYKAFLLLWMM